MIGERSVPAILSHT
jgi:hypothetical protein